ncbi:hypothetical protein QFW82_23530 [Streptomyces malaysiensis subsp. malaysiensis]|uniref:hypothetical protein n=1 Tax=Streptomyces malaysiensis TaxID=92644 RepID=UPI0024C05D02|nr:hypothetical protein [Streptomyces sp. NA07423]WHX19803.1 hypothetical protein QFW82_23530 [Streptomyces sp. NA07423]
MGASARPEDLARQIILRPLTEAETAAAVRTCAANAVDSADLRHLLAVLGLIAYVGHRCSCGHTAMSHKTTKSGKYRCFAIMGNSCGRGCSKNPKSELIPANPKGYQPGHIAPPGEQVTGLGTTCDCCACQSLHQELMAEDTT